MIPVGAPAPTFALPTQTGQTFRLADLRGRANVLLLFLPAAFTPICTTEVPAADALADRFWREANTIVAAVTADNTHSNLEWAEQMGVKKLPILSDFYPHGAVARQYGCLATDGVCERCTVIIDRQGIVRYAVEAGRYRKRSLADLLAIATRVDGGVPVPNGGALLRHLDLPIVYVTSRCPHCATVRQWILDHGLSDRVVVRVVDHDPDAMRAMLAEGRGENVPLLVDNGGSAVGDAEVIRALQRRFRT